MPAGKRLLRVNLNETAVRCFYTCSKGVRPCRAEAAKIPALRSAAERASRRWQRMGLTHVGLICDDEEVQLRLPQVILASDKAVLKRDATLLEARLRRNVYLVRGRTGWMTSAMLASILELLGRVLAADGGQWQPVLLMDALPSHYSDRVLRAASRAGVWVIIVPAYTMHLRQPLDTEAFLPDKRFLRARYAETRVDDAIGRIRMHDVVDAVNAACGAVLQGRPCSGTFETTTQKAAETTTKTTRTSTANRRTQQNARKRRDRSSRNNKPNNENEHSKHQKTIENNESTRQKAAETTKHNNENQHSKHKKTRQQAETTKKERERARQT